MTARLVPLTEISRPKQWRTLSQSELSKTGYPVYGANGKIGFYGEYNHEEPTLLIGCRGSCGCINISEPKAWITGNAMCLDSLDPGVELRYLYHFLSSYDFSKIISGTSQPQITFKGLMKVYVPIPSAVEQKQIARGLDGICELKKNAETRLAKLDVLAKVLYVEMIEDGHYASIQLGDEIKTTSGGTPASKVREYYEGGTIPWLTSGEVNKGVIRETERFITEAGLNNSSAKWVPKDSVVIAMYGATAGKVGLIKIPLTTNQAVCTLLHPETYDVRYLYYAVKSNEKWMIDKAAGGAQPNISQGVVREMKIPKPPLSVQHSFAEKVDLIDKSKAVLRETIDRLDTLYRSKLQEYFG